MLLLGIDVGTTGAKATVFDEAGKQYGYGFTEYGITYPSPGAAEQDGESIWQLTKSVIATACRDCGIKIGALSLSVQGDAVTAVDSGYHPLIPFQLGMDYRCVPQAEAFEREYGAENLFERTGMRPHPMNSICKIRHLCENRPDIASKAYKFMTYSDFFLAKLGADTPSIDATMASRTMAADLKTLEWIPEILDSAGIRSEQLSVPVSTGTVVGKLKSKLAAELGIRPGALIVAGGHDQTMAALGAGLTAPGLALDSHGTAEVISTPLDTPRLDHSMLKHSFPCYPFVIPGMYFTFSLNHTAGILLKWWAEGFCREDYAVLSGSESSIYSYLTEQNGKYPTNLLVLPSFNGSATPGCDLKARGAIFGLTTASTRYDIARAIMESLCFSMKENLEALKDSNIKISQLRCVGGGARSSSGLQLKADICNRPISTLRVREAACLGAAMIAGTAAGVFCSPQEASKIALPDREYLPDPEQNKRYEERFHHYLDAQRASKDIFHYLSSQ